MPVRHIFESCNFLFTLHLTEFVVIHNGIITNYKEIKTYLVSCLVFLPARRYASAGYRDRNVSVCPSVCLSVSPSVRPSRAGIVSKRRKLAA